MKSSCRAGLHRELLSSTSSAFHPVKRISGMHLKPYLKLQRKERSLEISPDLPRSPPMSQQRVGNEGKPDSTAPSLFPNPSLRRPLGSLSPNTLGSRNERKSRPEEPAVQERRASLAPTIHQGDDGDGPLDIWAVVKPGNTKEKIAFFAAQQGGDPRVSSMKNKSSWDIEGRATKRRKKSLDLKRAKVQLERLREASGRCQQPEPFACGVEHCSVHHANEGGEGGFPGRPLSVVEMVAFLEQRASVLLAGCAKTCPSASAGTRSPGQSKAATSPAPGQLPALGVVHEAPSEKDLGGGSSEGEAPAEPVRVLEMVAKLESECLRRQSEREAGSLSRNNSFRRNVARVLLASGAAPEAEAGEVSPGSLSQEERGQEEGHWGSEGSLSVEQRLWGSPPTVPSPGALERQDEPNLPQGDPAAAGSPHDSQESSESRPFPSPEAVPRRPCSSQSKNAALASRPREPTARLSPASDARARGGSIVSIISLSVARTETGGRKSQRPDSSGGEDALPGRLFLLLAEREIPVESRPLDEEASPEERSADPEGKEASPAAEPSSLCHVPGGVPLPPPEGPWQSPAGSPGLKRQRSHDFLETRFKIQQLLEPQQYLVFLPHHILVKIFGLLPTRSLVALKCTCGYFKFVIEYYNVRPADSRWVRDPRYREDPCKQCKKKYVQGDVSLCRWHPKPYCQALPYGPGYWMCCHRSQKGVPGCKLGLHDNHWVPACHSFNRAIHKKSRETDEDC